MTDAQYYLDAAGEVACRSSPAYVISTAGTETLPLLIGGMPTSVDDTQALCGMENPHWHDWTLPRVAEIMQRVAPWATTWCAPAFTGSASPDGPWMSQAHPDLAFVRSTLPPRDAIETVFHEAYHLVEEAAPGVADVLDELAGHATPWPVEYLAQPWEHRARLFESFGMFLSEGGAMPLSGRVPTMLAAAYSGEVGREIAAPRVPSRPSLAARIKEMVYGR